jgi:hypothetical protein
MSRAVRRAICRAQMLQFWLIRSGRSPTVQGGIAGPSGLLQASLRPAGSTSNHAQLDLGVPRD